MLFRSDMGWLSPKISRYKRRLRLWNRIVVMNEGRLTRKIFEWDHRLCKTNWSKEMKLLFDELEMNVFNEKQVCDITSIDVKLKQVMLEYWKKDVVKKLKLRAYVKFKCNIETEQFVRHLYSRNARSLFTQFRHGILPLKLETGRFKNLAVE